VYQEFNALKRGIFMLSDQSVAIIAVVAAVASAVIALIGLLPMFVQLRLVVAQLRATARQQEADSLVKLYEANRALISLGFPYPELFGVLRDAKDTDPVFEQHYLQLWINHLAMIHHYLQRSVFDRDLQDYLERETADFMTLENARNYWQEKGAAFSDSFQAHINGFIKKGEPPLAAAARHASDAQHLPGDLFKGRAGHPHEGLASGGAQFSALGRSRDIALDEHVAVIGENRRRAYTVSANAGKLPVFPDNLLDSHNVIFRLISLLKQNNAKCFNPEWGGAFV
jgi:hypothetical protein